MALYVARDACDSASSGGSHDEIGGIGTHLLMMYGDSGWYSPGSCKPNDDTHIFWCLGDRVWWESRIGD